MAFEEQETIDQDIDLHDNDEENPSEIGDGDESVDEEVTVSIGDDQPDGTEEEAEEAPAWVKEVRKVNRDQQKRIRELEKELKSKAITESNPVITLGEKPTLEACDYDAEKFERDLEAWHERKVEVASHNAKAKAEQEAQEKAWTDKVSSYNAAKGTLKVKDFEDAESVVQDLFSVTQQGIILQGAEKPELLVYALGKNPKKAKELASITDPVKYAFAVAKLESQLKVTKKSAPAPERVINGSSGISAAVDSQLERLRADAEKSGDYSKVMAYRNQRRKKT
jgi:hypothetical protein